jgi:hypothetical protein
MKLGVMDRLVVLNSLFPRESDFVGVRVMKSIREKVDIGTKEIEDITFRVIPGQGYVWDVKKEKPIDPKFSSAEIKFLCEQVDRLNAEKKVTEQSLDLCDRLQALKE